MKKHISLFILFFILLSSIALAVKPSTESLSTSLNIETMYSETAKIGEDININVHAFNSTSGIMFKPIDYTCELHLFSFENNWNHSIYNAIFIDFDDDKRYTINGSLYLNETGEYSNLIWCNVSDIGGYYKYSFFVEDVSEDNIDILKIGVCPSNNYTLIFIIILLAIVCIIAGLMTKSSIFGILGGFMFIGLSIYIFPYSALIFAPFFVFGLMITLFFGLS